MDRGTFDRRLSVRARGLDGKVAGAIAADSGKDVASERRVRSGKTDAAAPDTGDRVVGEDTPVAAGQVDRIAGEAVEGGLNNAHDSVRAQADRPVPDDRAGQSRGAAIDGDAIPVARRPGCAARDRDEHRGTGGHSRAVVLETRECATGRLDCPVDGDLSVEGLHHVAGIAVEGPVDREVAIEKVTQRGCAALRGQPVQPSVRDAVENRRVKAVPHSTVPGDAVLEIAGDATQVDGRVLRNRHAVTADRVVGEGHEVRPDEPDTVGSGARHRIVRDRHRLADEPVRDDPVLCATRDRGMRHREPVAGRRRRGAIGRAQKAGKDAVRTSPLDDRGLHRDGRVEAVDAVLAGIGDRVTRERQRRLAGTDRPAVGRDTGGGVIDLGGVDNPAGLVAGRIRRDDQAAPIAGRCSAKRGHNGRAGDGRARAVLQAREGRAHGVDAPPVDGDRTAERLHRITGMDGQRPVLYRQSAIEQVTQRMGRRLRVRADPAQVAGRGPVHGNRVQPVSTSNIAPNVATEIGGHAIEIDRRVSRGAGTRSATTAADVVVAENELISVDQAHPEGPRRLHMVIGDPDRMPAERLAPDRFGAG